MKPTAIHRILLCIVLAFFPLAGMAASLSVLKPKPTIIAGKMENFAGISNVITLIPHNPFNEAGSRYAHDLTKTDGKFHVIVDYVFAQDLGIKYGNHYLKLFIEPGDSIFVNIDAKKLQANDPQAVTFTGNNPEPSRQIAEWDRHEPKIVNPKFDPTVSLKEYYKKLEQLYNDRVALIAEYARTHEMSERMQEWAAKNYIFSMNPFFLNDTLKKRNIRWDIANAPVFDLYNEENFQCSNLAYHINNLCFGGVVEKVEAFPDKGGCMSFLSENAPEGTVRDMILYMGISGQIQSGYSSPEIYEQLLPKTSKFFSQPVFQDHLRMLVSDYKKLKEEGLNIKGEVMSGISYLNSESQIESLPTIDPIAYLAEKHKDKILYIDEWSVGCGPCIEEMKHYAPALQDYFRDKNVVFVNLCMASKSDSWIDLIKTLKIGGENYLFDKDASDKFMGLYDLPGYPHYLLIDKEGNLITNRAFRPSERDEAIKQIEALLIK